ncbi:MAG TPA: glycosyltransferase [Thermoleophilaceae bacterium]|nr:glycosyltransferase [Thermoleophilaceae bacterium]
MTGLNEPKLPRSAAPGPHDLHHAAPATALPFFRHWVAAPTLTRRQRVVVAVLIAVTLAGLVVAPFTALSALIAVVTVIFLATTVLRITYLYRGYRRVAERDPYELAERAAALPAADLPIFSVLVALYKEANVVPALLEAIGAIDYPEDRLEVMLLVEEDDPETQVACEQHARPGWRVLVVPRGVPKTKPRALNAALPHVRGEFFTIYDAEDRPEPDQLRKAVAEFRSLPDRVACLQGRLDFYNTDQNRLTRWFTTEYATHFALYLEGIAHYRHAMPLGGTSTHFRTDIVREVGGWDSWNVTEDCELGIRLSAAGYESHTLDSVTWEEACPVARHWVRQRSRWIKGFAQTALVMTRAPIRTGRAMGWRKYAAALISVGGVPIVQCLQVIFWSGVWFYFVLRGAGADVTPIERLFPEPLLSIGMALLLGGNFVMLLAFVSSVYQLERDTLVRYAVTVPVYWLMISIGAWKGVSQLVFKPHKWEKTQHGLAVGDTAIPAAAPLRPAVVAEALPAEAPALAPPEPALPEAPAVPAFLAEPEPQPLAAPEAEPLAVPEPEPVPVAAQPAEAEPVLSEEQMRELEEALELSPEEADEAAELVREIFAGAGDPAATAQEPEPAQEAAGALPPLTRTAPVAPGALPPHSASPTGLPPLRPALPRLAPGPTIVSVRPVEDVAELARVIRVLRRAPGVLDVSASVLSRAGGSALITVSAAGTAPLGEHLREAYGEEIAFDVSEPGRLGVRLPPPRRIPEPPSATAPASGAPREFARPLAPGETPEQRVVRLGLVGDLELAREVAAATGRRVVRIDDLRPDPMLFLYIPLARAERARAVPLVMVGDTLTIASAGADPELGDIEAQFPNLHVELVVAPHGDVDRALAAAREEAAATAAHAGLPRLVRDPEKVPA